MASKTALEKQRATGQKSGSTAKKKPTNGNGSVKKTQAPVNTAKTKKTTSSGAKSQSRSGNTTKAVQTQVYQPKFQVKETVSKEVRYLVSLLILVLFLLSICLGDSFGLIGKALHDVSVGALGISAYLFCIAGISGVVMRMWKAPAYPQYAKNLCIFLFVVAVGCLMHIINGAQMKTLAEWYEKGTWYTGGVVGGFLGMMLMDLLGKVGSILLLIGILIICLVVITEKSAIQAAIAAIRGTQKVTKNVEANVREKVRQHQELRKKAEEEQRQTAAASQMEIHLNRVETQETPLVLEEAPDEEIPSFLRRKEPAAAQAHETKAPEAKPQGKKPIKDGILDIPLISYDEYRQKKEAHLAKNQAATLSEPERKEEPVMVYEPETVVEPVVSEPVKEKVQTPNPAEGEKAIKKADPVTKEEQAKVSFGIQQNLFADQQGEQEYVFPSIDLLDKPKPPEMGGRDELYQNAQKLEKALLSFGVEATVTQVNQGPVVTRYELIPSQGVKVSRIVNLADDIALHLAAPAIRIEAPIPGKSAVGIEVPNKKPAMVSLREIIESDVFRKYPSKVAFSLGKAIDGEIKVTNIASMPHLLIAGATGSGKSVCINALLISILYKAHPRDVKLILVDPKVVELSVYNGIPHLLLPVVNDPKKAAAALNWAVQEMNDRYKKFADMNVRDLKGYNEAVRKRALEGELMETLPQIVIVVDELADLMMVAGKEVETAITRLGQMARAAGMHLVLATQRPSVDVINGVIKANIPSRLAFAVSSGVDSKTILDTVGAENLLGKGDMLFQPSGQQATRIQGAFVSDAEVERVVNAVKGSQEVTFNADLKEKLERVGNRSLFADEDEKDEYLEQAIQFVVKKQRASSSMLQREYRIGFNRAARLIDAMYERGIVGPDEGSKPRKVLMTEEEYNNQGANQDE